MSAPIQPWTLLVVAIFGWIQREQQAAIVYLLEENKVLKARLRGRKLRLTEDERRRLAVKGKALGRKLLAEVAGIVTPETLLAWHRRLSCAETGLQRSAETSGPEFAAASRISAIPLPEARSRISYENTASSPRPREVTGRPGARF